MRKVPEQVVMLQESDGSHLRHQQPSREIFVLVISRLHLCLQQPRAIVESRSEIRVRVFFIAQERTSNAEGLKVQRVGLLILSLRR